MENYPLIQKSIETADIISFDFEFGGLEISADTRSSEFDSHETRYQKLVKTVELMNAFQIGLCTFKWDQEAKKYIARPFNIFLFPHSENHIDLIGQDPRVLHFTTSALKFNVI